MLVKICFGRCNCKSDKDGCSDCGTQKTKIIECSSIFVEEPANDGTGSLAKASRLTCYREGIVVSVEILGGAVEDHVYILDKGETADHMIFCPAKPTI